MAHPFHHSLSSARTFGGSPADFTAVHTWFDASKAITADPRHRALRHHREGIDLAIRLFGERLALSDGTTVALLEVADQHVVEDVGFVPRFSDWVADLAMPGHLARDAMPSAEAVERDLTRKWGGEASDYRDIVAWFGVVAPDDHPHAWQALRHHAEGIFMSEAVHGLTIELSNGRHLPTRWIGERYLGNVYGRIPSYLDWMAGMKIQPWMSRAARKLSHEFDLVA